jgi:two-component system, OmpR family, KDP operon response regulator KdpE
MTTLSALAKEQSASDRSPQFRRVLLVEDEVPLRTVVARNLTSRGIEVSEAGSATEAIRALTTDRPDVLLLDINLPDQTKL